MNILAFEEAKQLDSVHDTVADVSKEHFPQEPGTNVVGESRRMPMKGVDLQR